MGRKDHEGRKTKSFVDCNPVAPLQLAACLTIRRDFLWEGVFIYSTEYHQSIKSIMFVSSSEIPKHSVFSRTDRKLVSGPAPPVSKRRAELNADCRRPAQANEKVELLSGKTYLAPFQLSLL